MRNPDLKLRRPWGRIGVTIAAILVAGMLFRCGTSSDDNKDEGNKSQPPVTVPTDWDGQSDWQNSEWKVSDE